MKMYLRGLVEMLLQKEEEDEVHLHEEALLCTAETIKEDVVNISKIK